MLTFTLPLAGCPSTTPANNPTDVAEHCPKRCLRQTDSCVAPYFHTSRTPTNLEPGTHMEHEAWPASARRNFSQEASAGKNFYLRCFGPCRPLRLEESATSARRTGRPPTHVHTYVSNLRVRRHRYVSWASAYKALRTYVRTPDYVYVRTSTL